MATKSALSHSIVVAASLFLGYSALAQRIDEKNQPSSIIGLAESAKATWERGNFFDEKSIHLLKLKTQPPHSLSTSAAALANLWMLEEVDYVKLTWWRSKEPLLREFSAALLLLQPIGEISLDHYREEILGGVKRFSAEEGAIRSAELKNVFKHRQGLSELLRFAHSKRPLFPQGGPKGAPESSGNQTKSRPVPGESRGVR